ncbi:MULTISPECIES: SDR family oxidoreductase [Chryseobacterium]|uniref:3-oxoacyl-[acyl-carrier protein] reductase n=1 Tax=Chryseobacterium camelliae TaxID=1265445 RepID=A0ABU0TGM2_9FLAO|nr:MULTISPECIES: SDR family oxidoreductase [Chryseobacterium]MDT3405989.1 3-oxoacyl-[acyl-carrier protein] reductase [Pseudacidovorax intermedius]MDQ1096208.1 3-oxoacyl-[acyl-carrier protein] reductase [Chryseobacterium camelliae]MDQ1100145.1 3-oxoacyl-[acyl-carrier protein] reductase [Chryseobacterium sp. SORGH_AS_1048]MDR6087488.1 3-oxoacyl-[acyl-carrier protein] reductase [Chryseobacterium sp. SORGH_AS_0909]MDR6131862.1 3-oxoacyl-[acyl-carrier protein] reductase [Chryseobacterium sp. SORGH_
MNIQLNSKNALVGAATGGIGAGIATELAKCGANVTVMARNEEKLKNITASLPVVHAGQHHRYLVADFSDFSNFKTIINDYFREYEVDILVNNTNGPKPGKDSDLNTEDYQSAFDLLFKTVCETTHLAIPKMIKKGSGRIINVSSSSVKEPIANLALSNSIRSAVAAWAKTLSLEIAQHQITVNNILTGSFDTQRIESLINEEAGKTGKSVEEIKKAKEDKIPMKRLGKPEEYGQLVAFLASDYASYITGTSIPLDGGMSSTY